MTSGGIALWVAVLTTPILIRWLLKNKSASRPRGRPCHLDVMKAGTPTMGGISLSGDGVIGSPWATSHERR